MSADQLNNPLKHLEKKIVCFQLLVVIFLIIQPFNFLYAQLSPGELHKSHAQLEGLKNCSQCHGVGQKIAAENCLKCHELLRKRIADKPGLHSNPEFASCENCHVEHQGRNYDLIWWEGGQENFDHSKTGFFLQGKHAELKCRECHQAKFIADKTTFSKQSVNLDRTFLGLQKDCLNCHHDEHRGELGSKCLDCHQFPAWKPASLFDHSKTKFPLTGKHLEVSCLKCHPLLTDSRFPADKDYSKYRIVAFQNCTSCHQDIHQNKFGIECTSCHNTTGWKNYDRSKFNHETTRYPLRGKHRLLACEKCHLPGKPRTGLKFQKCQDCHTDYHRGQFLHRPEKGACESCHDVKGFVPAKFTIEQHNQAAFILDGSHLAIPCTACHNRTDVGLPTENIQFHFPTKQCIDCHKDPHWGSATKYFQGRDCNTCHSNQSWQEVKFDHSQTAFPLEFSHSLIRCTACHTTKIQGKVTITALSRNCQDCHKDPHNAQFEQVVVEGKTIIPCQRCHTSKNWIPEKFDHNQQAAFKIEGAHSKLACKQCHPLVGEGEQKFIRYKPIPHNCADCHGSKKVQESEQP